jgi:hypothetical protein
MVLKIGDENQFSKFIRACNNIIGGKIQVSRAMPGDNVTGGHGAPMTEEIFNSSALQWQTGTDPLNNTAIFSDDCPHGELTWTAIQTEMDRLQAEWDAKDYARDRKSSYPEISEFMEAYTEKEIGGDSTKWDAYVIKYNKVRTDNPKG